MQRRKPGPKPLPENVRFFRYVQKTDECWIWTGGKAGGREVHQRYGVFRVGSQTDGTRRQVYAHHWSYTYATGEEIPDNRQINHTCDNPNLPTSPWRRNMKT